MNRRVLKNLKKNQTNISLLCLAVLAFFFFNHWSVTRFLDADVQDWLVKQRATSQDNQLTQDEALAHSPVVIIDIDDASLSAMSSLVGKWPWPRSVHAELLEYLLEQQPKAVVFDVLFSEPDVYRPDSDAYFAEVVGASKQVYLAALEQQVAEFSKAPLLSSYPSELALIKGANADPNGRALFLLPNALPASSWNVGTINFTPDEDGVGRRYDVNRMIAGWKLPSLPAKVAQGLGHELPHQQSIILDWQSTKTLPYPRLSYAQLLSQARQEMEATAPDLLKDKIIIIGTTAAGLLDIRPTPISENYPGVFIMATAIDNLVSGKALHKMNSALNTAMGLVLLIFVCVVFLLRGPLYGLLLSLAVSLGIVAFAYFNVMQGLLVSSLPSIFAIWLLSASLLGAAYAGHRKKLSDTISLFSRFLDPQVVKSLVDLESSEQLLGTKSCELTILFSDIRDFTSLSENTSPQDMIRLLNQYFDGQVSTLFSYKATLDKFIGDAVMAFWGAPVAQENEPVLAINAALDMIDNLQAFRQESGYTDFNIGIGIHTGSAVVGMLGTQKRYDYTAIGDAVNLASRIEGLTKNKASILVSESTKNAAEGAFEFTFCGEYQVKGRSEPVRVYEPQRLKRTVI